MPEYILGFAGGLHSIKRRTEKTKQNKKQDSKRETKVTRDKAVRIGKVLEPIMSVLLPCSEGGDMEQEAACRESFWPPGFLWVL